MRRVALLFLAGGVGACLTGAAGELPALHHRRRVVGVLDVAPALEHERAQPSLGQLVGCPATVDSDPTTIAS
jgi:hypothetical protein